MRRLIALVALLAIAACSRGTEIHFLSEDELPERLFGEQIQRPREPRTLRALVYFVTTNASGHPVDPPHVEPIVRRQETNRTAAEFALGELLAGPTTDELATPVRTAVPVGTELLGVFVRGGVADVNLTAQFETAAAELLHLLRIAQVVWTLTDLPGVRAVRFRIHGSPQPVIDQFGRAHEVVTRARYSHLAPTEVDDPEVVAEPVVPTDPDSD